MPLPVLNSEIAGPKFTQFLHNVGGLSPMNVLKLELWYSILFWNAKATNLGKSADFVHFNHKIGCHGNIPWAIRKEGRVNNLWQNT